MSERGRLQRMIQGTNGVRRAIDRLYRRLEINSGEDVKAIQKEACQEAKFAAAELRRAAKALLTGSKTDKERGLIMVRGSVPGVKGAWVSVRDAVKRKLPDSAPKPGAFKAPAQA